MITWLQTPGCLALGEWSHHHGYLGHEDLFLYSSVYSCHLFLISYASVKSILFLSFIVPIFAWNVPLVSLIFLKWSLVFPILFFSSISLHWSLRKAFLSLLAVLWNSAFKWVYLSFSPLLLVLFFPQLFVRPLQTTILPFCISFLGMVLITASCTMSWTSLHSSSGTLSIWSNHLNLYVNIYPFPLEPPSHFPTFQSHPSMSSQSAELSTLCYTATSH